MLSNESGGTMMYKTILVPLDGSSRAEKILPHIEMLAKCMHAKVILLCVYRVNYGQVDMAGYVPGIYDDIAKNHENKVIAYLYEIQQKIQAENLEVKCFAEEGDVVSTILSVAEREGADLIAMSSHGRTGLARVFYGSVAAGVLHKIDRPLLLVRAEHD
jgi:nucleotide-binding universal stress UspA family protein